MAIPNQILIDSPTNTINIQTNDNQLRIISPVCNTEVTVTQPTTTVIQVATLGPQGPQGPQGIQGLSYERLSDFQSPYQYSGNAPLGTPQTGSNWTINRIDFSTPGSPITLQATGPWVNRYSLIYL